MRISDWSSDVCSSDLVLALRIDEDGLEDIKGGSGLFVLCLAIKNVPDQLVRVEGPFFGYLGLLDTRDLIECGTRVVDGLGQRFHSHRAGSDPVWFWCRGGWRSCVGSCTAAPGL